MIQYSIDYSRYIKTGFWVSPLDTYAGHQYTPISTITVEYGEGVKFGKLENITVDDILGMLVSAAEEKGANGLISVKIERRGVPDIKGKRPVWYASGVAINIEEESE